MSHKTFSVDEPETFASFIFRQTFIHEEINDLLGDTDTSATGT
jgi:hypothetical protein